jgi:hypothetical protein
MFASIRARISRAYAALFAMTVIALSVFVPQQAHAGYSVSYRSSYSVARVYSAPRVYVAPRIVAPRAAVVVSPRPVYVAPRAVVVVRRPLVVARPVVVAPIVPYVAPQVVVPADGQPVPVVAETSASTGEVLLILFVSVLLIVALGYGFYGYSSGAFIVADPFDVFTDALIMDEIVCADGGLL